MKIIQGFVTKDSYISNVPGVVSKVFEVSPNSLTYSRERGEYQHLQHQGDILHAFMSKDNSTGEKFQLTAPQVDEVLKVIDTVLEYLGTHMPPYVTVDFLNFIQAEHQSEISNVVLGDYYDTGSMMIPEWISWKSLSHPDTEIRIWMVDQAFQFQYPDYEIVVVPPVDDLDRLFNNYVDVSGFLSQISLQQTMERVQEARGPYPSTYTRMFEFNYTNPMNPSQKTKTAWGVLIYGREGDNIDSIKDAIIDHVLDNSTRSQVEWQYIFPEIFQRTEFLFWPRWDKISIPNLTSNSALYSSLMDPTECLTFAKAKWPQYTTLYVDNNLTLIPFDYKAVTAVVLNGNTNVDGKKVFREMFPDYIPVPNTSHDFGRMTPTTQGWVLRMIELLVIAETATAHSPIPPHVRRVVRQGVIYICSIYDNINYLVATKSSTL